MAVFVTAASCPSANWFRSGWVANTDLIELDPTTVKDMKSDKMRKDLQAAHDLAAAQHPLSHYKELLHQFQEDLIEQEKNKAAKAATPKSKKAKATDDEAEDVDMVDAGDEDDEPKEKKAKKRKAEDSAEVCLYSLQLSIMR